VSSFAVIPAYEYERYDRFKTIDRAKEYAEQEATKIDEVVLVVEYKSAFQPVSVGTVAEEIISVLIEEK